MSVTTCIVSGTLCDMGGTGIYAATIEASNNVPYFYGDGSLVTPDKVTTTTAFDGTWSLTLVENVSTSTTTRVTILIPDGSGGIIRRNYQIIVPNTGTAAFASLATGQ